MKMEGKKEGTVLIRISAKLLTVCAILYLILGTIAVIAKFYVGSVHGSGDVLVLVLTYGTAILAPVAAFIGFRTASETMEPNICKITGVILTTLGLISTIYILAAQSKLEVINILVTVCGIFYIMGTKRIHKN